MDENDVCEGSIVRCLAGIRARGTYGKLFMHSSFYLTKAYLCRLETQLNREPFLVRLINA